jgi:uncharacterized protein YndB with AHSA1/START domain
MWIARCVRIKYATILLHICTLMQGDTLNKEQYYPHSIADVWRALSEQEELSAWFVQADFRAEVGYRYTFTRGETKVHGEVIEVMAPHRLAYTWSVGDLSVITTVRWRLEEAGEGTRVFLEHSGISGYPTHDLAATMFSHFEHGWLDCFTKLDAYLTSRGR